MPSDTSGTHQFGSRSQVEVLPFEPVAASSGPSAIVLVHWQIRSGCEAEFLHHWRTVSLVGNRSGLVGEFLSEVVAADPVSAPFITWLLSEPGTSDSIGARHFVNVGMWLNEAAFLKEVAADFGDDVPVLPFELCRRRRLMLHPDCWRIGASQLPLIDSVGVQ